MDRDRIIEILQMCPLNDWFMPWAYGLGTTTAAHNELFEDGYWERGHNGCTARLTDKARQLLARDSCPAP